MLISACGSGPEGAGGLSHVPRNRTLILDCESESICGGQMADYDRFNPYLPNSSSRTGWNFLYEPLYFYNAYREEDNLIPWIAEGHEFNEDFTEVTVTIRDGVKWSDGERWTAADMVFTMEMLKANAPELTFSTDMQTWVREAVAVDDLTVRITLNAPNPRFIFTYFTHNFDNGVVIVPKHIWEGKDPKTFANFDPANGLPVITGPYEMAMSTPQQKVWDRRQDWWAKETGFRDLPAVQRIIYLTWMEETKRVQSLIANDIDTCLDLRPPNIEAVLDANPKVTTWTGREPPYGYLDWWPISLGFNILEEPFSDVEIRRAISHAIDREQLVKVGWNNAGSPTLLPLPNFPPLARWSDPIQDLVQASEVGRYDLEETSRIMTRKGWRRDEAGFWSRKGERLKMLIDIYTIFQDLTPVLIAQLQKAGFDANFRKTPDAYTRMSQGLAKAYLSGNGGSVRDPYFTLRLYHSRFLQPTGTATQNFWRWKNEEFDALVDRMGETATDDPELARLFRQAMEIWLRELPSIPLVQWYHRIPHNETYWTNWPNARNPYINSAYWHRTWLLVLLGLQPVQP